MRYPVGAEFATNLANVLYDLMLDKGQSLASSLPLALQMALQGGYNAATPPISAATPALFGRKALDLTLKPLSVPKEDFRMPSAGLAYFPDEPKRFVGRVGPLGRASSAVAGESDKRGVLFHGMAGAGKTACALELAYHLGRSQRFQAFVWHRAPAEGSDIGNALTNFALDMEKQLPGFKMAHIVDRAEELQAWLPMLSNFLAQNNILIVLDNVETLLTSEGKWRDRRWDGLVEALLNHSGQSRLILTSRVRPVGLDEDRLLIEPIHALSLDEAVLLAREMPNLGKMLRGKSSAGPEKGREIVLRTLKLVQGHPKLIELADAQAADPKILEKYLESATGAWSGEENLDRFFLEGESVRTAEVFLKVLTKWTQDAARSLLQASRTLFHFLCALEDADRMDVIVKQVWPELWKTLDLGGDVPGLDQLLSPIKSAGLVQPQIQGEQVKYIIHPGVAQAGLEEVDEKFRATVDAVMASFWRAVFDAAGIGGAEEAGQMVITAGLRSAPYLMRQKRWSEASTLLEHAIDRDMSPETIALVLPLLRHIAQATKGTDRELIDSGVLANALRAAGRRQEAEEMVRSLIQRCVAQGKFRWASAAAGLLFKILHQTGRFGEAAKLVEEKKGYTRQAGLGPWSQLSCESQRLQALNALGEYEAVLKAVEDLRVQMKALPERSDQEETATPWNIREAILDAGRSAAERLGRYEPALELNLELIAVGQSRGATELELALTRFNDYGPLLRLKRYDKAGGLLLYCKEVFEKERSIQGLSAVFSALADLRDELGQVDQAVSFEEMALRYKYLFGEPESISISHYNLAIYLMKMGSRSALDHRLAAASIFFQIGSGMLSSSLRGLASDLDKFDPDALPGSFDQFCARVEQVEGVRFRELWDKLPKRAEDGDQLLKALIEAARGAKP